MNKYSHHAYVDKGLNIFTSLLTIALKITISLVIMLYLTVHALWYSMVLLLACTHAHSHFYLSPYNCYLRQLYDIRPHCVENILQLVYYGNKSLHARGL